MKKNVSLKEMKCLQNHGNFGEIPTAKVRLCRYREKSLRDFFATPINAPLFFIKDGTQNLYMCIYVHMYSYQNVYALSMFTTRQGITYL